ncbi:hypothetical protein LEN26_001719 [Aphanomyces euteiches]|nr:hypothetical protein LEN26_001719 [Aphanomyces euteiches]
MHLITASSDLMERIAQYLPTFDALHAYLEAFDDNPCLDNMQAFRHLSAKVDKADLWPELHIRQADWIHEIAPLTAYVKRIHTHCFFDPDALQQILSPHNIVIVECFERDGFGSLSPTWVDKLAQLPVVEIWTSDMDDDALVKVLPRMPHLRTLHLEYGDIQSVDQLFEYVSQSKLTHFDGRDIQSVVGSKVTLTNQHLDHLSKWLTRQCAVKLALSDCNISADQVAVNKFCDAFWSCTTLREFSSNSISFPRFGIDRISTPIQMTGLTITNAELSDENIIGLAKGLPNSNLKTLNLKLNYFGPEGYQAIMQGLAESNVTEVSFICCDITTPIFEIIGNTIGDTKLKILRLCDNYIEEEGYKVLLPGIGRSQLEVLDMAISFVSDQEIPALAAGLPLTKLMTVILEGNNISDVGASLLAEAMAQSPHLCHISLANNQITEHGVSLFVDQLSGRAPTTLNFQCNKFALDDSKMNELRQIMIETAASQSHTLKLDCE